MQKTVEAPLPTANVASASPKEDTTLHVSGPLPSQDVSPANDLREKLLGLREEMSTWFHGHKILERIEEGDLICCGGFGSTAIYLHVDSEGIKMHREKFDNPDGIPIGLVRRHFDTFLDESQTVSFFEKHGRPDGKDLVVDLSTFLETKSGNCFTLSTLCQLSAQAIGRESYLVQGGIVPKGDVGYIHHAWNMMLRDGTWYNVDAAQNVIAPIDDFHVDRNGDALVVFPQSAAVKHEYVLN